MEKNGWSILEKKKDNHYPETNVNEESIWSTSSKNVIKMQIANQLPFMGSYWEHGGLVPKWAFLWHQVGSLADSFVDSLTDSPRPFFF